MKKVTINGIKCLLFEGDEKAGINPAYPHEYYIRHADDDWDMPATVEKFVAVNKFGFIQAKEPIAMTIDAASKEYAEITSFIDEDGEERIYTENESLCDCGFCGKDLKDGDSAYGLTGGNVRSDINGFGNNEEPWIYIACPECQDKNGKLLFGIQEYLKREIRELVEHLKNEAQAYDSNYDGSYDEAARILWEKSDIPDLTHLSKICGEIQALFGLSQKFNIELSSATVLGRCDQPVTVIGNTF